MIAIKRPQYECLYAAVESNGRVNDSGIWNKSPLLQEIQDRSVKLPNDMKWSDDEITPDHFLEHDAFVLKSLILKPFPQQSLTGERRVYNY